jgi:type II secretory pathway pseudopilin PulG
MIKSFKRKFNLNLSKGFTLIETFVAITILMIIVLGPMSLLSNALKDSRHIGDQLAADYLAQEGVELMMAERNQNGSLWTPVSIGSCQLRINIARGYFCDDNASDPVSIFSREIKVEKLDANKQYQITSTVSRTGFRDSVSSSIIFKY